ncbi:MAG: DUF1439 domain-containing protein [Gammaproteobacteria bacterium]|nr:DUF1439 domain-containing protein [Gammaproteobacteria bacterium]MBT4859607.1 DUF1439 domain-containing protein [Gammaproteobacteria bacterium]MBT6455972.1 DUF1439 domain-containing protein [Gammaproteobacteria bacterium]MBT7046310.1 DUF1439 domain-containing protein [Gammaproteobacteria bacterium]
MMPLEKNIYLVTVILSYPVIDLTGGNNLIGIFCHLDVLMPGGIKAFGMGKITGTLSYNPDLGEIFLNNPEISILKIQHVSENLMPIIQKVLLIIANKLLSKHPVYKLTSNKLKHKLAMLTLKSITVANQKLLLEFSILKKIAWHNRMNKIVSGPTRVL